MENTNNKQKKKMVPRLKHKYGSDYQMVKNNYDSKRSKRNICDTHIDGA